MKVKLFLILFICMNMFAGTLEMGISKQSGIDLATNAMNAITYEHHEIHAGDSFWYDDIVQLASAGVQNYVITTPDTTKWAHFGYFVESTTGGVTVEIYEACDRTPTTAQTVRNRDRNSAVTATTTVHKDFSAGSTDGTKIVWTTVGTTTAGGKLSGQSQDATERILKQNTKYIVRVTSKANTNDIHVRFNWYEHTNSN